MSDINSNKLKFTSSLLLDSEEVQKILLKKIEEESTYFDSISSLTDQLEEDELLESILYSKEKINILSLFSGAGGLDLGIELSNYVVQHGENRAYNEFYDPNKYKNLRKQSFCNFMYSNDIFHEANQTYLNNFPETVVKIDRDIRKIKNFPKSDLILGGFPCPGFSSAGPRLIDDPRNFLYIHYIRALLQSKPKFFIAENVKGLMTLANGQVLKQIEEDFQAAGYQLEIHLVNSRNYGVPQLRERVFIVGTRKDIFDKNEFKYILPPPTHGISPDLPKYVTLSDSISDLPLETDDFFDGSYSSMYLSRNRKKSWDEQSFTIQASGRQAPLHPHGKPMKKIEKDLWVFQGEFNRRLSVKEISRIQTFPDWFVFSDGNKKNVSKNNLLNQQYKQIGNAVPVILAEKIARPIINYLINTIVRNNKID